MPAERTPVQPQLLQRSPQAAPPADLAPQRRRSHTVRSVFGRYTTRQCSPEHSPAIQLYLIGHRDPCGIGLMEWENTDPWYKAVGLSQPSAVLKPYAAYHLTRRQMAGL